MSRSFSSPGRPIRCGLQRPSSRSLQRQLHPFHEQELRLRIACVLPFMPRQGIDHAGGEYIWRYCRAMLALGHHVTVLCPETDVDELPGAEGLQVVTYSGPAGNRVRRLIRLVGTGLNVRVRLDLTDPRNTSAVEALQRADVVDLQFTQCVVLAPQMQARWHGAKAVVGTAHDVASQSSERARTSRRRMVRLRARITGRQLRRTERVALNACDHVFVFNPEDAQRLQRLGVQTPVSVTPPWVDTEQARDGSGTVSGRVVFPAAFWRQENDESAAWMLEQIWPLVLAELPQATLWIAGSRPSPSVQAHHGQRGVHVTGYVDDLNAVLATGQVMVAPLVRGAGLKFKVLQGIALGVPVVGTSIAAEGVEELLGELPMTVADSAAAFAAAVVACLVDRNGQHHVRADRGRALVAARLDFNRLIAEQAECYQRLVDGGAADTPPRGSAGGSPP